MSRKRSWSAAAEALRELLGHRWVRSEDMTRKRARTILKEKSRLDTILEEEEELQSLDYNEANFF